MILHCFSMSDRIDECLAHDDWWISFAGNVTYPKAEDLRLGGAPRSRRAAAGRDRRPVPGAAGGPRQAQRAGQRGPHGAGAGGRAPGRLRGARGGDRRATPPRCSDGRHAAIPRARPELPRRPQHPRRDRAAGRAGRRRRRARDRRRARGAVRAAGRARRAPACDRGRPRAWSSRCATRSAPFANVTLHIADALEVDLAGLAPDADQGVANLPYGIAATVILRTIEELPTRRQLGGDGPARGGRAARRRAGHARATASRRCSRSWPARSRCCGRSRGRCSARFPTSTRCWSACGGSGRRRTRMLRRLVHDAFAHRRKALAGSLALAPGRPPASASAARAALDGDRAPPPTHGPSGCRRRSSPSWPQRLGALRLTARAPGKVNLCLLARRSPRRRPPRARDPVRVGLAVRRARADGASTARLRVDEVVCPGVEGPNLVGAALAGPACAGLGRAAGTDRDRASGSRWPRGWAAARRMPPRRCGLPRR